MKDIQLFADDLTEQQLLEKYLELERVKKILEERRRYYLTFYRHKIKAVKAELAELLQMADSAKIGGFPDEAELSLTDEAQDEDEF